MSKSKSKGMSTMKSSGTGAEATDATPAAPRSPLAAGPVRIRPATRDDIAFLVDANAAMAQETEHKRLDRALLTLGVQAVFDEPRRGFYLIAELDGRPAGCLLITYEWSDWRCGDWWWIQSVYVMPEARRHGVFRALYAHVEAAARAVPGVVGLRLYVEWENERAQQTYRALGMEQERYHFFRRGFR